MDHPQQSQSHSFHGKNLNHARLLKSPADDGISMASYQGSDRRRSFLYSSRTSGLRNNYASTSNLSSMTKSSRLGLLGTSDDSISELDTEIAGSPVSDLMEMPVWDHAPKLSSAYRSISNKYLMERDDTLCTPSSIDTCTLGWGTGCLSQPSRVANSGSKSLSVSLSGEVDNNTESNNSSQKQMRKGSSSRAPHADDITAPLALERRYKYIAGPVGKEGEGMSDQTVFSTKSYRAARSAGIQSTVPLAVERRYRYSASRVGKEGHITQDQSICSNKSHSVANPLEHVIQSSFCSDDRANKRNIVSQNQKSKPCESGPKNRQVNSSGASTSRLGLGNLVCSSASDVLPSVSSSSFNSVSCSSSADVLPSSSSSVVVGNHVRVKKNIRNPGDKELSMGSEVGKEDVGKVHVPTSTCTSRTQSVQETNVSRLDQPFSRVSRQSESYKHPVTRSHGRRPVSMETLNVTPIPPILFPNNQNVPTGPNNRWNSPVMLRSQDRFFPSSISSNPLSYPVTAYREHSSHQRTIRRRSVYGNHASVPVRLESRASSRNRSNSSSLNYSQSIMHEIQCIQPSFIAPLRQPPVPQLTIFSEISAPTSVSTQFSASSRNSNYHYDASGSLPLQNVEETVPALQSTSHRSSTHSEERRSNLTAEGLSEILSALEHIERDEGLSYQQLLMLEATILLGGIGLQDRYRDMRADIDNMSYEELLALQEQIGNVNTGLSEESILKCLKVCRYLPPPANNACLPQDIGSKCSICQEEFEKSAEIGVLNCEHSYHIPCIKQWLLQKNQCPICKAAAVT